MQVQAQKDADAGHQMKELHARHASLRHSLKALHTAYTQLRLRLEDMVGHTESTCTLFFTCLCCCPFAQPQSCEAIV